MKEFSSILVDIIKKEEFIVFPGIGSFNSIYTKPFINDQNELIGPQKSIEFKNYITGDQENKLIGLLSSKMERSTDEVGKLYHDFVLELKNNLKAGKECYLANFGIFRLNEENNLEFKEITFEEENLIVNNPPKNEIVISKNRNFIEKNHFSIKDGLRFC